MPCVGSCSSKNTFTRSAYETFHGSKTTRTASVCPVWPEQTSSYDGCGVDPPAYPADVDQTPGIRQKISSAPQKQPSPKTATSKPSGMLSALVTTGVPSTTCSSARVNHCSVRP